MTTITGDTGGIGTKAIAKRYPVTSGLTAGTQKQEGRKPALEVKDKSLVYQRDKVGI